jgi:hypothetical protein
MVNRLNELHDHTFISCVSFDGVRRAASRRAVSAEHRDGPALRDRFSLLGFYLLDMQEPERRHRLNDAGVYMELRWDSRKEAFAFTLPLMANI